MKMAKASQEEWQAVMDFVNAIEEKTAWHAEPATDAELAKLVRNAPHMSKVVFGYSVLIDNCADPNADTLEFNQEIQAALDAYQTNTGSKLVGRELKSLTPEELEELLKLAGVNLLDINELDPRGISLKEGQILLHPKYEIIYQPSDGVDFSESIEVTVWSGEAGDCEPDTHQVEICVGEVVDYWGGQNNAVAVVKWFLDHGWKWIPLEENKS